MTAHPYRGRIAPSPTGMMHVGHARTFLIAWQRARQARGVLVYRNDDLDRARCKSHFDQAARRDLNRFGINWQEGPDCGGEYGPYNQSERQQIYEEFWLRLHATGMIYPCERSRKDIKLALSAPHENTPGSADAIFPKHLRPHPDAGKDATNSGKQNWRFRVPDDFVIEFDDLNAGRQIYKTGQDLGDFLVWRRDGFPSYEFAVVLDDHLMQISEVVRGADLLLSTARQLLLYDALNWTPPAFYHCQLVCDERGDRLSKRDDALSLHALFESGKSAEEIQLKYFNI